MEQTTTNSFEFVPGVDSESTASFLCPNHLRQNTKKQCHTSKGWDHYVCFFHSDEDRADPILSVLLSLHSHTFALFIIIRFFLVRKCVSCGLYWQWLQWFINKSLTVWLMVLSVIVWNRRCECVLIHSNYKYMVCGKDLIVFYTIINFCTKIIILSLADY